AVATPPETAPSFTLGDLRSEYMELHSKVLDARTVNDMKGHWKHLERLLGKITETSTIVLGTLQTYVMARVGEGVEPATAKKEIVTLRTCWNWALRMGRLSDPFPNRGIRFPKGREKPPFMTFSEIEKRISAGESQELWESVFLTRPEIEELLSCVELRALHPWVYPVFCFAAHTGARRGEILRALLTDVD